MTDSRSLHQAVNLLLRSPTRRIDYIGFDGRPGGYTVTAPCLLVQLADAVAGSTTGSGARTPGSRTPLNTDALDLLVVVDRAINRWAADLGVDRRPYLRPAVSPAARPRLARAAQQAELLIRQRAAQRGRSTRPRQQIPPAGLLLRAVAAAVSGRTDRQVIADEIEWSCRRWDVWIRTMLDPNERLGRDLNRLPCPDCGVSWVVVVADERGDPVWRPSTADPTQIRKSALWIETGVTGVFRCAWCRSCGRHRWRDDLASMARGDDEDEEGEAA